MAIVGIIAEYNPFHRGHAHHLRETRSRMAPGDILAVAMSGPFTQRGDAALLSPGVRARMALEAGADAVFALPACWALRDGEHFALGGVRLLSLLGATALSFGAETADVPALSAAAALLESPPSAFTPALRRLMDRGLPYPAALAQALESLQPGLGALAASPNNTLAICYLRAIQRLGVPMRPLAIPRRGHYHATQVEAWPSATALRGAVHRGDWASVSSAMPQSAYRLLAREARMGRIHRQEALDMALLYRLRTMADQDWHALPDLSEGIEERLRAAAQRCNSREAVLQAAKTRRYPYARLSRLCTHALLGVTAAELAHTPLPDSPWLLGFRDSALPLLRQAKERGVPIISKAADVKAPSPWFRRELRAYDLWALGCGLSGGLGLRQGVVRV